MSLLGLDPLDGRSLRRLRLCRTQFFQYSPAKRRRSLESATGGLAPGGQRDRTSDAQPPMETGGDRPATPKFVKFLSLIVARLGIVAFCC